MLKRFKLNAKLWGLTSLLLLAILLVSVNSIKAINEILKTGHDYSQAADYSALMIEKELEHFIWIGQIKDLFIKNADALHVEMDHTQCDLGKLIYSENAAKMASQDPEFAAFLEKIKAPHKQLHDSARAIKTVWRQRHTGLISTLKDLLDDHRVWAEHVSRIVIEGNPDIPVQLDHTQCALGAFLESDAYEKYAKKFPELRTEMQMLTVPHEKLHHSAQDILERIESGKQPEAADI